MSLVIAIDVGIKNLGICVYDFCTSKVVYWDNATIVPNGRYAPAQNVQYVRDFVWKHQELFNNCAALVIERQMRCNMRIIESVFQTLYYDRCHVINARCVKMHYGLSTRNYRLNKQKAVEWATNYTQNNPDVFVEGIDFATHKKKDDLADCLLLVMYYLDTYSNQLSVK